VISFRYLAEEMATGIFSGVAPAAHSLAAIRSATRCSPVTERRRLPSAESSSWARGSSPPDLWILVPQGLTDHGRVLYAEDRAFRQFQYPTSPEKPKAARSRRRAASWLGWTSAMA
jgi:hypothetical protein